MEEQAPLRLGVSGFLLRSRLPCLSMQPSCSRMMIKCRHTTDEHHVNARRGHLPGYKRL
jgi:hypothetical protein